ncbi:hypothetical protein PR002_g19672 [Phytophthora rubi]|uniref:Integrase catalytic domain-containing protein n=1 Tax=Phytophthora rubi TaxID=129364 RepID=A0A6A3JSY0_9STRA|nr:hypothetical protein PR002_g19672 [Phytophthora rubi]
MLKHFDENRESVVIVYASDCAISGVLTQVHDDMYMPVKFTSRTLKTNELNYDIVEKEILVLLRVLNECYTMLAGKPVRVLTRHTTLAWLFRSRGLEGRLSQWAAILSPWKLQICRSMKGEEELLDALAASITPRAFVDAALEEIAPRKRASRIVVIPVPDVARDEVLHVLSFDGSAKVKREGGAYSAVIWQLPNWEIVRAASGYATDLTVNEAEYRGLLLGCSLLEELDDVTRLVVCGDSNLVIRQMRDEMDCKSPGLKLLRQKTRNALQAWPHCELFHVRRDWNASADMLAGQALQRQGDRNVHSPEEIQDLKTLNRLEEVILPRASSPEMASPASLDADNLDAKNLDAKNLDAGTRGIDDPAAARTTTRRGRPPEVQEELVVQRLRLDRIRVAQDEEVWIVNLKKYLRGDVGDLSRREVKNCQKLAPQYEEGESGLLYYQSRNDDSAEGRDEMMKLVIPETLREDVLHHYHASLEGGHQGIGRTYQRVRRHFHWPGIFRSVQRYVGECTDCETGKGRPTIQGESPGNIVATYPFQVIAMDHIPSLPASYKGNTELLVWVDLFTGFVVVKANASRTAQTVAEAYE